MNINGDLVIQVVLALLPVIPVGTISALVLSQFKAHRKAIEDRLIPVQQQAHVESLVRSCVMAVEQTCGSLIGPQKKFEAVRMAQGLLGEAGIHVSQAMLETLIEQAVFRIKQGTDPSETQVVKALTAAGNTILNPPAPAQ